MAQLTTKGSLSFELNATVVIYNNATNVYDTIRYVAKQSTKSVGTSKEVVSPFLTYPLVCGCLNPDYLEYSSNYACSDSTQCKKRIIFGCKDPQACNYDPKANVEVSSLCCYPGYCNDRDLSLVCPSLSTESVIYLYPNPAKKAITLKIDATRNQNIKYSITNSSGVVLIEKDLGTVPLYALEIINISNFQSGIYHCQITVGNEIKIIDFVKQE